MGSFEGGGEVVGEVTYTLSSNGVLVGPVLEHWGGIQREHT